MPSQFRFVRHLGLVALMALIAAARVRGAEPDAAVKKSLDKMLAAIVDGDREAFIVDGTDEVKRETTPEIMDILRKHVGGRLKEGYEATYLCELKQAGHDIHLWKVTFKDKGDDNVVKMIRKDGKVAGFFLQ